MKKKSFLSGIGAKLALAAVALTTVVFTSCEKEEFNVEPIPLKKLFFFITIKLKI
jgi:hypothetical protein